MHSVIKSYSHSRMVRTITRDEAWHIEILLTPENIKLIQNVRIFVDPDYNGHLVKHQVKHQVGLAY